MLRLKQVLCAVHQSFTDIAKHFSTCYTYVPPHTPEDDANAIASDWKQVGQDLNVAMRRWSEQFDHQSIKKE